MDVPKSDGYARTSMRLTIWCCVAGLAIALAIPVYLKPVSQCGDFPLSPLEPRPPVTSSAVPQQPRLLALEPGEPVTDVLPQLPAGEGYE